MRKLLVCCVAALVGAVSFAPAAAAGSGQPLRYSADAFFTDMVGCVQTFVGVFPVATKEIGTGRIVGASMNLQIDQFDVCAGTPLLSASPGIVVLVPGELTMSPSLRTAQMHTVVTVHDVVSGRDFPVSIGIVYQRVAPRSQACTRQVTPDETTTYCSAVVSGAVSEGASNFTPAPGTAVFQEHHPRQA